MSGDSYGQTVTDLAGRSLPEPAWPVGYAALIAHYGLRLPLPPQLAIAAAREHPAPAEDWLVLRRSRRPTNTLAGHLDLALRREGVNLAVLNALFRVTPPAEIAAIVRSAPTGAHTRRLWFLYEWLTGCTLDVPDPGKVRAVPVVNPQQQVALRDGEPSPRHRVRNNLPGTSAFCPMVRWTSTLTRLRAKDLRRQAQQVIGRTHPDVVARAAAFMLLSDSRSSFAIEGERPPRERVTRWGQVIAQAGARRLSVEELERLQRLLIDDRFVALGLRTQGGFVGDHDRVTHEPLPEHISARAVDVRSLTEGVVAYDARAVPGEVDPIVAAAVVAFGFVYIHPFVDGNGRLHRWLIHHVLAAAGFSPPGVVFPVSAAILRELEPYRRVLQSYSYALLPFIDWRPTPDGNVEVLNDTAACYRFFDATAHAEFLYRCVEQIVEHDLPAEVAWIEAFDRFEAGIQQIVDMPPATVSLLHRFLAQDKGRLSKSARTREFGKLKDSEISAIEELYARSHPGRQPTQDPGTMLPGDPDVEPPSKRQR